MDNKELNAKTLQSLFEKIKGENDSSLGYYTYKDFKIKVVKPMSGSQRYSKLYNSRRENGLCIACGAKVKKSNPTTGKLYRLCEDHRNKIDGTRVEKKPKAKKAKAKAKPKAKKAKAKKK